MIIEYVRYVIPAARHAEFVEAYESAAVDLRAAPECRHYEVSQGIEEPDNFVVRIEWDSMEGHLTGFRGGAHFGPFFSKVKPFFADIREMKHYRVHGAGASNSASAQ